MTGGNPIPEGREWPYWTFILVLVLASFFGVLGIRKAWADEKPCGDYKVLKEYLEQKYNEVPTHRGLSKEGLLVEVFVSPSGSYTIMATNTMGLTCGLDAGEGWTTLEILKGEPS